MIKNEKQYQTTQKRLQEFNLALEEVLAKNDIDSILKEIEANGIRSQIDKFEKDLKEYESLKSGEIYFIPVNSLEEINEALIKARIIKRWSQADLASRVNLQEQQIQRYEATNYDSASIHRLKEISDALELDIPCFHLKFHDKKYNFSTSIDQDALSKAREKIRENKSLIGI